MVAPHPVQTINAAGRQQGAMPNYDSSYLKTTVLAGLVVLAAGLLAIGAGYVLPGQVSLALDVLLGAVVGVALVVVAGGVIVLHRQRRTDAGRTELFLELTRARSEQALDAPGGFRAGPVRRAVSKALLGHEFLVGDEVEILPLAEILATLDERGTLGGIPFQAEMAKFCGRRGRVFRCVDKIYDYGRTKGMRELNDCVLVSGLRCDGAQHGGCQALCYLMWKTSWLRRVDAGTSPRAATAPRQDPAAGGVAGAAHNGDFNGRYQCQFTELHAASLPLPAWSVAAELRPLSSGNITVGTFVVGLGTRAFTYVQDLRGGISYPPAPPPAGEGPAGPVEALAAGDLVRVRPMAEIARTLNRNSRNKGLWFDRDMIKHCGTTHRVLARVDRIIDDANGEMRQMKTPCIMLAGVDYSGEFLRFNAQHDYFFWREAWLERLPE